ncbi:MAG: hypothetical protein PHN75_19875, partial [Syntrophales bacterium]|nr:hypothetical protein [Syntrophales bacterium]
VFPGHRRVFPHYRERIAELKHHHDLRSGEIIAVLKKGRQNAFQAASQMTWDVRCDTWGDFPVFQKWFATGETLSHLRYLQARKEIIRETIDGKVFYALAG